MAEKLTTNKDFETVVDYIAKRHDGSNTSMVYLMVLKHFADVVTRGRLRVKRREDETLFSFSGMAFSRTGGGKDRTLNTIESTFFGGANALYKRRLKQACKEEQQRVEKEALKRYPDEMKQSFLRDKYISTHSPREIGVSSDTLTTPEGYIADRVSVSKYRFGAVSVVDREFGDTLESFDKTSKTLFMLMKTAWDKGETSNKSIKMEKTLKTVEGVPMCFFGHSTVANFTRTKAGAEMLKLLSGGWYRRSLIAYDATVKEASEPPEMMTLEDYEAQEASFKEESKVNAVLDQTIAEIQGFLLDNSGLTAEYDNSAGVAFVNYEKRMKHLANRQFLEDGFESLCMTDYEGRAWQVFRLAGLFCVLEKRQIVNLGDVKNAISVVEHFSKQALKLVDFLNKPNVEQFKHGHYDQIMAIANEKGYFNLSDLKNVLGRSNYDRNKNSILEEIFDDALNDGFVFRQAKGKRNEVRYMLERLPKSEDVIVSMSLSETCHNAEGYKWHDDSQLTLETAVALTTCGNYSAGRFKGDYRKKDNWLGGNTMLIYDVDSGTTIEEAKSVFLDTACAIMPTKSHQKEKNGVICDRFRVFLPLAKPIDFTDAKRFGRIMKNVSESFNLNFDEATKDPSRMFFKADAEALNTTWFNPYAVHFVDWRMFDHETMGEQELRQITRMHNGTFSAVNKSKGFVERCVRKLCQNQYYDGNRNSTLFRCLRWLRDAEFTQGEAEALMLEVTSVSPLPAAEWKATFRSAWR